jgi:hypothetical protein
VGSTVGCLCEVERVILAFCTGPLAMEICWKVYAAVPWPGRYLQRNLYVSGLLGISLRKLLKPTLFQPRARGI